MGVLQASHLPLGIEGGHSNRRTRKRKQTTCLEQGISQSNQLELVLGRHKVGSCTYTSLCSGYHCHSGPEGPYQLSRAGLGPGDLTKAEVTGRDAALIGNALIVFHIPSSGWASGELEAGNHH